MMINAFFKPSNGAKINVCLPYQDLVARINCNAKASTTEFIPGLPNTSPLGTILLSIRRLKEITAEIHAYGVAGTSESVTNSTLLLGHPTQRSISMALPCVLLR